MKQIVTNLLGQADVTLNGDAPWDIQVHDERFYRRVIADHNLGLGESYMEGWWDCPRIDMLITRLLTAHFNIPQLNPRYFFDILKHKIFNYQNKVSSKEVADKHYNLGNDLYKAMLDSTMNYSCGYWQKASNLEEAQQQKMELICRKLMLTPGMRLLDIGCGWGSLAKYAAENFGVEVVGITISAPQKEHAEKQCRHLPVTILLQDYRELSMDQFDRVVSVGMFEHVGYKNYSTFMEVVGRHLKDEGIFLLHTIGSNTSNVLTDLWINKYIFPNGMLPSIAQIANVIENRFIMEDWHNFGADYDKTLCAWHQNFLAHWPELKASHDEAFYRMWNYYLLSCAGAFRARTLQLWQIILTKSGLPGGFHVRDI